MRLLHRRTAAPLALALMCVPAAAFAAPAVHASRSAASGPSEQVIVTGQPGAQERVVADIAAVGGRLRTRLSVIDGATATVPVSALATLASRPGVRSVVKDASGHLMGIDPTLGYDVGGDGGSLFNAATLLHAKDAWNAKITGAGVDVALIDSGISPVQGLTSGNVVNGPDLSFDSQNPALAHLDAFGHGTHMASIIAGRDAAGTGASYAKGDSHKFNGIAPDARIVSVKVAASDGSADVSQVIAGIDWVAQHAHTNGLNIKVLNLSYGTDSTQSASVDPLDYAVENAWRAGITVVVSGGNNGGDRAALTDPANDPLVLAVGAVDDQGKGASSATLAPFSQAGTASRYLDILAPGVHMLGLRDTGSSIDQANSSAVVNGRFFRGSGTSQAAAAVSGLVALYLQKYPAATPDQVKRALMLSETVPDAIKRSLSSLGVTASPGTGLGIPDVNKALGAPLPAFTQAASGSTGTGTLEGSRGSSHVTLNGVVLSGETDIFGNAFDSSAWSAASAAGTSWNGGQWNGDTFTASPDSSASSPTWDTTWSGNDWSGHAWAGHAWAGHAWAGSSWDGHAWAGDVWDSVLFAGHAWAANSWGDAYWG